MSLGVGGGERGEGNEIPKGGCAGRARSRGGESLGHRFNRVSKCVITQDVSLYSYVGAIVH